MDRVVVLLCFILVLIFTSIGVMSDVRSQSSELSSHSVEMTIEFQSPVLARLGPAVVTQHEIDAFLDNLPEHLRGRFIMDRSRLSDRLDLMLITRLAAARGIEEGMLEDPLMQAKVHSGLMQMLGTWEREAFIEERLLDDYENQAREQYLANPSEFRGPTTFDFKRLFIAQEGRTDAEAARRILELEKRIHEGESFDALVSEYSEDPDQPEGGYREVELSEFDKDFGVILSRLETTGRLVGPFQTDDGWHLLRLNARHPGRELEWEEAREKAIERAKRRHRERVERRHQQTLLEGHEVEISDQALEAFWKRYGVEHHFE